MVNLQMITDVPSSSSTDWPEKYDVFLSFRGKDTRNNFTSHLYDALIQKKVKTFIDYELERGDEISTALMKAIEESHASIIIFSENYASSKWCLEELSKIMECKKAEGYVIIPVFYKIDPSHVRNQIGSYQQAFKKHEQDMTHNMKKVQKWRGTLTQAGKLAGWTWNSQNDRTECEFIKDIVGDVMKKLNLRYPIELKGLVGIDEKYAKIESLLKLESNEVRIVGIWGMGGVGKTTLATALYAKLSSSFDGECFLENIREESEKNGLNILYNKLFSKLLKEENFNLSAPGVVPQFVKTRLRRTKVFIVLDDVATFEQLENLIIDCNWLGLGSRVIVTTRNMQVLNCAHEIYKVRELNHDDSLELFCAKAFCEKHPKNRYAELIEGVIDYCKGLPLALNVLGALLHGRSIEVWEDELGKLKTIPNVKIHDVLKLSYDNLDLTQKNIFLDIACFLKGKSIDHVKRFFEACHFFPKSGIQVLLDMSLITISSCNIIEMHDLIQEMGRQIVQQSNEDPRGRSRLWNPKDICDILNCNNGSEVVEGIMLDMSQIQKDIILSSDSFANMPKLRYLEFCERHNNNKYYVHLPNGLGSLPYELRYLCWPNYCPKFLPSTFCTEMLVELHMPNSNLEKLWDGVQNLGNLKTINLKGSKQLVKVPDLGLAQNLVEVSLIQCESLCEVHPSIFSLPKLMKLDLNGCTQIESLTTHIHMKSLRTLILSNCSSLKEFSVTSEEMFELELNGTAINDLPSSFLSNTELGYLYLEDCDNLKIDWNKLFDDQVLEYLWHLSLNGCKQVDATDLGHILEWVPSLFFLDLSNCCNLEALPDNIGLLSSLVHLDLSNCCNLESLPDNIGLLSSLDNLNLSNCCNLETLPNNIGLLSSLKFLNLSNCCNLETLPDNIGLLSSLYKLDLRGSNVKSLPANVNNLSMLEELHLDNCLKLVAVPKLPPSLVILKAANCTSLELDTNFTQRLLLQHISSSSLKYYTKFTIRNYVMLPGGHVPELFTTTTETASISIPSLPLFHLCAFLLCIILPKTSPKFKCFRASCDIYEHDEFILRSVRDVNGTFNSDHVIFWHVDVKDLQKIQKGGANDHYNNISFQFAIQDHYCYLEKEVIKGCGVLPVYAKDLELKLGGIVTKDIVEFQSNVQCSNNQETLPQTDTQMQDEKKELIENDSSDCFVGNDIKLVYELVNPQQMVVKPAKEYNDIVELESNPPKTSKRRKGAKNKKNKKEMQQRKSMLGSPSGTDDSGYSFGNQLIVKGKKQLSFLFIIQVLFLLIGVIITTLSGIRKDNLNIVAFYSIIVGAISLIIAELGRRRSLPSFLRFYAVVSSVVMPLLIGSLAKQYSLLKAIRDFSFGETRKFGAEHFLGFQNGLLVYLLTLLVFNIFTLKVVVSLLFNMSHHKKAS